VQRLAMCSVLWLTIGASAGAQQAQKQETLKIIPPPGIKVDENFKKAMLSEADKLDADLALLLARSKDGGRTASFAPDILIFSKAVRVALLQNEIYDLREMRTARELIEMGRQRLNDLSLGTPKWNTQTGLVVRGYRSAIDDSIQPYGLVVPASHRADSAVKSRLDIWLHGRGEKMTELAFLDQRRKQPGEFTPPGAIVLHPYGRYCNAFRFAGETDVFEALADVKKRYRIDDNRIVMRGFSMGGAGCWQFATHHSGLWCAAAPGAGFSETADFLKIERDKIKPTWYEQKLWNWYDSTTYARNIFNVPTVAYSGEIDRQKQAADFMAAALVKEGMGLTHIIGPKTAHKYEPKAREEVNRRIDQLAERGRVSGPIQMTTHSLRYNHVRWLRIDALKKHWEPAGATGVLVAAGGASESVFGIAITGLKNVSAFSIILEPGSLAPFEQTSVTVQDAGADPPISEIRVAPQSDRSLLLHFAIREGRVPGVPKWEQVPSPPSGLVKRHGLQGPIDDAFMGPFAFVRPTGPAANDIVAKWVDREMKRAIDQWRRQFRGEPIVIDDVKVTDEHIKNRHLVLWGDAKSNAVLGKIAKSLPLHWSPQGVSIGQASGGSTCVPIMIYPNPLNGDKYVVLNSGFTFREDAFSSNARQTPRLPDWAIVDAATPMTTRTPGTIIDAGFFDEAWKWQARK
jgi:hypothetical protein